MNYLVFIPSVLRVLCAFVVNTVFTRVKLIIGAINIKPLN